MKYGKFAPIVGVNLTGGMFCGIHVQTAEKK